jgi:predicted CXXCH cytochrome family protein
MESLVAFQQEPAHLAGFSENPESQGKKRRTYRAPSRTLEQLFNLGALPIDRHYRLRILVGEKPGSALAASQWLALDLSTAGDGEIQRDLVLAGEGKSSIGNYVRFPQMTRLRSGDVLLAWKTDLPLFGWIELEAMGNSASSGEATDMVLAEGTGGLPGQHPPLRNPEALSVTACYQCHPASSLGTSHPVRLYGGKGVRIPDELPTVDGMLTCVTCHDPHGSAGEKLVRERIKTRLCVACHYQFRNSSPSTMFD